VAVSSRRMKRGLVLTGDALIHFAISFGCVGNHLKRLSASRGQVMVGVAADRQRARGRRSILCRAAGHELGRGEGYVARQLITGRQASQAVGC
jgi:hypothetical protein